MHRLRIALSALALAVASATIAAPPRTITLDDGPAVRLFTEDVGGRLQSAYSIERADGSWTPVRVLDPHVHLRYDVFDPLGAVAPRAVPAPIAQAPGARLFIVQLETQWLAAYGAALEDLGVTVHQHLPATARLVRMDPDRVDAVAALDFVRWVGPYHPAYRADESILETFDGQALRTAPRRWVIRLVDPENDRARLAQRITALGGTVDRARAGALLLEATLDAAQLEQVLRLDEVLFVDPWSPLEPDMDIGRAIGGADFVEDVGGFDGEGIAGEILDGSFNVGHTDFLSRPLILHTTVSQGSHGASCSGIIFGDGTVSASKRGLLPAGQGIVADTGAGIMTGQARYDHTAELKNPPYEAVFQTASVGSSWTTQYSNISAEIDELIFDLDITLTQSQSNTGSQQSRPQAWAKNIIAVGGVNHLGTLDKSDDYWQGASVGPAADGRVKPDLTHFYEGIGTVTCCGANAYTEGFGGTSGATPIVAGYVGLFYDMWAAGVFNNEVDPTASDYENRSHHPTAKAMMVNAAVPYDWTGGGPNGNITRYRQGWGMPSAQNMLERGENTFAVDEDDVIVNLETRAYFVTVLPDEASFRATLTWNDLPGTTSSTLHRINDLDLRVTSPDGELYHGNGGLENDIWSSPGGLRDEVNTVENVFVLDPTPGEWMVEVAATELNEDGHVETPALDADYALVVSGVVVEPPPLIVRLAQPVADLVPPATSVEIRALVLDGTEEIVDGSVTMIYRPGADDDFVEVAMAPSDVEPDVFVAVIPDLGCARPQFYLRAEGNGGTTVTAPTTAPDALFGYHVGVDRAVIDEDFEIEAGWTVENDAVTAGAWERGDPVAFPADDFDGSGSCWVTGLGSGEDLDGGPTTLITEMYDLADVGNPIVTYARWMVVLEEGELQVDVSNDAGGHWTEIENLKNSTGGWSEESFILSQIIEPTSTMLFRFRATDLAADSPVEIAIDAFRIDGSVCDPADLDGDGNVDFDDLVKILTGWGTCADDCRADLDGDGKVDENDLGILVESWGV